MDTSAMSGIYLKDSSSQNRNKIYIYIYIYIYNNNALVDCVLESSADLGIVSIPSAINKEME